MDDLAERVLGATSYSRLPSRNVVDSPFTEKTLVSYGIVAFSKNTQRWLLIRRKYSPEFLSFLRGSYRISGLSTILRNISREEREKLESVLDGGSSFDDLFLRTLVGRDRELEYARNRFYDISTLLIEKLSHSRNASSTEWLFPKGRPTNGEDPFICALREFTEETGLETKGQHLVSPYEIIDSSTSINGRKYETRCWVYIFDRELPLKPPDLNDPEVGERRWVTTEEALKLLRKEKAEVLELAKKAISKYQCSY